MENDIPPFWAFWREGWNCWQRTLGFGVGFLILVFLTLFLFGIVNVY